MHELSIVMNIVDIAEEQVRKAKVSQVDEIELDIGALSGVEMAALQFAWTEGVRHTVLAKAKQKINPIPAKARCLDCTHVFGVEQLYQACPKCGEYLMEIIQGKELKVKKLVVS